jgi:hypothetical protein
MFGQMFKSILEPFTVSNEDHQSQEELRYYYGDRRPNAVYSSGDRDIPLTSPTATYMGTDATGTVKLWNNTVIPKIDRRESALNDKHLLPNNALTNKLLEERQRACESLASGEPDQFTHLSNLAANVNEKNRFRCGWIYNTSNPVNGRGAYGSSSGSLNSSVQGTWMWDLQAAKKKYHIAICNEVKSCDDLSDPKYKGRCGFCKTTKKGVPITGSVVAYPYDPTLTCSASSLTISSDKCPVPQPPPPRDSPAYSTYVANKQVCDPLNNGALPRDCLITKAQQVCSDKGTLVSALKSGSDTNYLDTLSQAASYNLYQQRAAIGLSETSLKTGKLSVGDALREFRNVADNAASAANAGLKAAASDLCFTKGSLDSYDFCSELQPSTKGPFPLSCLQAAFQRAGGQKTGEMYPTASNMNEWNSYISWKDVTDAIDGMAAEAKSTDRGKQEQAIANFYGFALDDKKIPLLGNINNVEIFWFSTEPNIAGSPAWGVFLGRRIRSQIPNLIGNNGVPGEISKGGSFVFFTNMQAPAGTSVKLRVTTDAGFILNKDKPLATTYSGMGTNSNNEMSAYQRTFNIETPIENAASPWTLSGNNIITGCYAGGKNFKVELTPIVSSSIPQECGCYGKASGSLRMYTKDECENGLNGNWYSNGECIRKSGGSFSAMCGALNSFPGCAGQYDLISGKSLYLLQDPYAPMISFEARQNYADYNCDYFFCDKRLSSRKMKFAVYGGVGPTPNFVGKSKDKKKYTLGKSFLEFRAGSAMMSTFLIKIYSFMTMTFMIRFTSVPATGTKMPMLALWASYPSIEFPSIYVTGLTNTTARIDVGSLWNPNGGGPSAYGVVSPPMSSDGPTISINQTYLITLRAIRGVEGDISTLKSLQIGAATISDLQKNPSSLKESSPVTWPNPLHLDNPNSGASLFFLFNSNNILTQTPGCNYDLFGVHMYDYYLTGENLKHAALNDWAQPAKNIYT